MTPTRRLCACAWVACLLGCGAATSSKSRPSVDASADSRAVDSGADARSLDASPDAHTPDARGTDAHAADAHASDAHAADAHAADAHAADAHASDARPTDANAADGHRSDGRTADAFAADVHSPDGGMPPPDSGHAKDAAPDADASHDALADLDARTDADAAPGDAAVDSAPPTATTLTLSLALSPAFSTSISDYYVRCSAGTNTILVTMTAAPGSTIGLLQPVVTMPSVESSASVSVSENQAIVVGVTTGGTTDQYWVRCLPENFPQFETTLYPDAGTPTPGYYLVGNTYPQGGSGCFAMVLDTNGVPVWYDGASTEGIYNVQNLTPGTLSFVAVASSPTPAFQLLDLPSGTTSTVMPSGYATDFHELQVLPNGDYVVLAAPPVTGVDLTGLDSYGANETMLGCIIQELDASGTSVWQWDITDHFDPVADSTYPRAYYTGGGSVVDTFHCNAIDVAASGDLLVSARNMDSVFLVSRSTGAVLWKLGGATASLDNAPYISVVGDPQTSFHRQHDARLLPGKMISMFDDQTAEPGPARAIVYSYDLSSDTASVVWQYPSTETSGDMGSFRILADGSRTIGWGYTAAAHAVFSEVTEAGQDILDFGFDDSDWTYRAIKIPASAFDLSLLRSTAGGS